MNFICKKSLTLNDQDFGRGDFIPANFVLPERVRALTLYGYIEEDFSNKSEDEEVETLDITETVENKEDDTETVENKEEKPKRTRKSKKSE